MKITFILVLLLRTGLLFAQELEYYSSRAISINDVVFEEKANILGISNLNPVVTTVMDMGDSVKILIRVYYQHEPVLSLQIFHCSPIRRTWRHRLANQYFFKLQSWCCEIKKEDSVELLMPKKNSVLLIRDPVHYRDVFLHLLF